MANYGMRILFPYLAIVMGGYFSSASGDAQIVVKGDEQQLYIYSSVGGLGPDNGIEWQIDAPWRLEPTVAGNSYQYDAIPIVITVGDVTEQPIGDSFLNFERFCGIYIMDGTEVLSTAPKPVTFIPPAAFYEIEGSTMWRNGELVGVEIDGATRTHEVRRMWNGDSPDYVGDLSHWAEWNAVALYTPPVIPSPGEDAKLIVVAQISQSGTCGETEMSSTDLLLQMRFLYNDTYDEGRLSERQSDAGNSYFLGEFLKVHYGEAPLPRFSDEWVYGDLHYHSQGTDNEGEMGTSYRGALQAMKAMGLDYALATEHASDGQQIIRGHHFTVDDFPAIPILEDIPFLDEEAKQKILDFLNDAGITVSVELTTDRDMNAGRFAHLYRHLNDVTNGANVEVGNSGGSARRPHMILGGELDAISEMFTRKTLGYQGGRYLFGNGEIYKTNEPCYGLVPEIIQYTTWEEMCTGSDGTGFKLLLAGPDPDRMSILDVQGLLQFFFGRQHMMYLPFPETGETGFISSATSVWGGGTKHLKTLIDNELRGKGYMFLAHPVHMASGTDGGRLGPDIMPWSEAQLETAFAAPEVLGVEFWNEDGRLRTNADRTNSVDGRFPFLEVEASNYLPVIWKALNWSWGAFNEDALVHRLYHGAGMWDELLRWGITPARLQAAGRKGPRKMFVAGGSDAHGDLNFRRTGRGTGWSGANDTAIGKPRNLTFVGPRPAQVSHGQVVSGLVSGQFSVTDGPIVRIAIDSNLNGVIDDGDVMMGGDYHISGRTAPLLVEWKSTAEFGNVEFIDLYVGVQAGDHKGLVYASSGHAGMGGTTCASTTTTVDSAGRPYCVLVNNDDTPETVDNYRTQYVRDESGLLRIIPDRGMFGTVRVDLDPTLYRLFKHACEPYPVVIRDDNGEVIFSDLRYECTAESVQDPESLFVRAYAETESPGEAGTRRAFSNPIWMTDDQRASAPVVTAVWHHCDSEAETNYYDLTVGSGFVGGDLSSWYGWHIGTSHEHRTDLGAGEQSLRVSLAPWTSLTVGARACNVNGCTFETIATAPGVACDPPPPPPTPNSHLEWVGCSSNINSFVFSNSASNDVPVYSWSVWYRVNGGTWTRLNSSLIQASGGLLVESRVMACNTWGCSPWKFASQVGPTCSGGGLVK